MKMRFGCFSLSLVLSSLVPAMALGQAWVPPKGEFYFGLSYQMLDARRHLGPKILEGPERTPVEQFFDIDIVDASEKVPGEKMQSQVVVVDGDFGVTDRLALSAAVAYVSALYVGDGGWYAPDDDGNWHGSFQDMQFGARYMAVNTQAWTVTPFASVRFPTNDYAVLGHSSRGLGLNELQVGTHVGRIVTIDEVPRFYVQGSYSYAFMENVSEDVKLDRSDVRLELAYIHGPLTVQFLTTWLDIHGGISTENIGADLLGIVTLDEFFANPDSHPSFHSHDRALAARHWNLGGGLSFQVSDTVDLFVSLNNVIWGENTTQSRTVNVGMSWGFQAFGGIGRTRIPRGGS